ncbi:LPO_1073/Vpar_1526 family protein [Streptomyces sp. NBC_01205]|uniref:LPO_1073/Vpar_1526 family protein n=1 Tax=Streptomyces sp. NBC_01205 TaxID=2903771 RepID=UPI002E0FAE7D|nr:hypothetical protein OG573_16215 [Streptomyces sp. NBC_01205]
MKQVQRAGDSSTNYQAETIHIGLTYTEAREIALDVFRANALELSRVARETAEERVEKITDSFFRRLLECSPESLESIKDPGVQRAIFRVQEEYACSGDDALGQVLVDMLVDRCRSSVRDIQQVTLNEAIKTAPKLATHHFAILSSLLFTAETKFTGVASVDLIHGRLRSVLAPLAENLRVTESDLRHLQYAGCLSIDLIKSSLGDILTRMYPGLFTLGFERGDIDASYQDLEAQFIMTCLRDSTRLQVGARDKETLEDYLTSKGILDKYGTELKRLMDINMMSPSAVEEEISALHPNIRNLVNLWESSEMSLCKLTGVGIAIGYANARRVIDAEFTAEISVWVN